MSRHELSINRLEAFSDGVFAIAITLLILEIKIPGHEEIAHYGGLRNFLLHLWPNFLAYVFSFVIIGIYWANHHYFLTMFRKTDHIFNMLNVAFLMFIAFLPYPTALLGDFISDPDESKTVVTFYALGIWLPSIFWFIVWLYGKRKLIEPKLAPAFVARLTTMYFLSNVFYSFAFLISFWNSYVSLCLNVFLTLLYLLPPAKMEYVSEK